MLLTDWLMRLSTSRPSFCTPSRPTRRRGSNAVNSADISSQPETLEKRTLLSAADILLTDVSGATGFQINGESAPHADSFGNSMRAAGDVNGDGFGDVIIGAYEQNDGALGTSDTRSGVAYVLFGKSTGFSPSLFIEVHGQQRLAPPFQSTDGFRILGANRSDTGTAVSGGGDINGDGFDDLVVAAPGYSNYDLSGDYANRSSSYVIFGKANNTDVELSNIDLGASDAVGFRLTGFGTTVYHTADAVSTGGDINGDGFDDVVFGGPHTFIDAINPGAAYVVFGKESGFENLDVTTDLDGTTGFTFTDSERGALSDLAYIGAAVSLEGDVNGDGFDDLVVGAPGQNKYRNSAQKYDGEVYVIFGRSSFSGTPDGVIEATSLDGSTGFRATGLVNQQALTGSSVGSGGDVNGDGFDDLVIGAPGDGNYETVQTALGRAYVVYGKTNLGSSGTLVLESLSGSDGFVLNGGGTFDGAGRSVSINGDINGDGFDDVVVGAPTVSLDDPPMGFYNNGAAYVVFGDSSVSVPANLDALDGDNGFALIGKGGVYAGTTVAVAGDINGDGFDELMVGEPASGIGTVTFFFGTDFGLNDGNTGNGELGNGRQQIDGAAAGTLTATQGNSAADILVGGRGNDTLNADGGSDVLIGGSGDDILAANLSNFSSVPRFDGGTGVDTLKGDASFSGQTIDLTAIPANRINDIEVIDLDDGATETLTLDLATVLAITGAGTTSASSSPFATNDAHTLTVLRDSDDTINIGAGWTQGDNETIDSKTFEVFTQDGATVKIQTTDVPNGNIDGDGDFDTNDSFLVNIILLGASDSLIDSSKGASPLTAQEIRDGITALLNSGALDVDGDADSDSNDSFLTNIIKLGASDAVINSSKGASPLSATQIRTNVTALAPPAARPASPAHSSDITSSAVASESTPSVTPSFLTPPPVDSSKPSLPEIPSTSTPPVDSLVLSDQSPAVKSSSDDDLPDASGNEANDDEASDSPFFTNQIDVTMELLS
jgi:hypothetical protein